MKFTVTREHWDRALELEANRPDVGVARRCAATLAVLDAIGRPVEDNLVLLKDESNDSERHKVWSAWGLVGIDGVEYDGGPALKALIEEFDGFTRRVRMDLNPTAAPSVELPIEFELVPSQ